MESYLSVCHCILTICKVKASAVPLSFPCRPEPNCLEGFLKFVFPLANEPISTLLIKCIYFREAVSITSDQNAK